MMRYRILCLLLALCMVAQPALAEALPDAVHVLIPQDAQIAGEQQVGSYHVLSMKISSGEELELTWDARSGAPVSLVTYLPAASSGGTQMRDEAEALVLAAYPDAGVLFSEDGENGEKILWLLSGSLCGRVAVSGGNIISRELSCDTYARDGCLTMEGALAALKLYRPGAEFRALELDEDDGALFYEGDAWMNGEEYEFELDARTGRLVEWERD